jgi:beta-glucosidase
MFSIVVENTGSRDGSEVVQVYIKDIIGSVVRPKRELKRFKKIFLEGGHEQRISFVIPTDELKFYDANMNYVNESGSYEIYIGGSSQAVKSGEFTLVQNNSVK